MPDASIVVTMDDKYSDAVKKMSSVTKGVTSQITPTAKARALLRITSVCFSICENYCTLST